MVIPIEVCMERGRYEIPREMEIEGYRRCVDIDDTWIHMLYGYM